MTEHRQLTEAILAAAIKRQDAILDQLKDGIKQTEIARIHGVTKGRITQIIKQANKRIAKAEL